MRITRYEPINYLNQIQNEINKLLGRSSQTGREDDTTVETSEWMPSVDIKEDENRFLLLVDIPGVDPADVEISMQNSILSIRGRRISEKKEERENYLRVERFEGRFYRQFTLPDTADAENIKANIHQGVLEIEIPKKEKAKQRRINVSDKAPTKTPKTDVSEEGQTTDNE